MRVKEGQRPLQILDSNGIRPEASLSEIRKKLLQILRKEGPMNTCQVCRRVHGAHKDDINYCRIVKSTDFGASRWSGRGHEPYPLCVEHRNLGLPPHSVIYRNLKALAKGKKGRTPPIKTAKVRFKDPQKVGRAWDRMRFWGVGEDLDLILRQSMTFYTKKRKKKKQLKLL